MIEWLEELDEALEDGTADKFVGQEIYHGALRSSKGVIVKIPTGFYVKGLTKCTHKGCKRYRTVYFGSGCHFGAFCYAFNPKTGEYIGDFRNQEYRCEKHI
jgi:hypothetical protein